MNTLLERNCFDSRARELRLLAVAALVLLVVSTVWHGVRGAVLYRVACSSIGCPGRQDLVAAVLRQREPQFFDHDPQFGNVSWAKPEWIAWSSMRGHHLPEYPTTPPKWAVTVTDRHLTVRGGFVAARPSRPPADRDGDGYCEVVIEVGLPQEVPGLDIVWWVVLRIGESHNEIVWAGLMDESIWHSRRIRLQPVWRDEDGDGRDEFVFITVETVTTPASGLVFKPPQTIAVFEWASQGGILRTRLLPDDCGISLWRPEGLVPMRVDQTADLDPFVRELLPVTAVP